MLKAVYVQKGETLNYTNPSSADKISAGDVVVLGSKVAVAGCDIEVGATGTVHVTGVYELPISALAVNIGETVYWDAANSVVTKTATSNTEIGYAAETVANTASKIKVKLVG